MALAPLSQTVFLTEDGSTVEQPAQVTIPPFIPTLFNTLGTSPRIAAKVRGFAEVVPDLDRRLTAIGLDADDMDVSDLDRPLASIIAEVGMLLAVAEAAPVLSSLAVNLTGLKVGDFASRPIIGATEGSTITGAVPAGMEIVSADRIVIGTPTEAVRSTTTVLTETLAGARYSPRPSTIAIAVTPPSEPPDTANTFATSTLLATEVAGAVEALTPITNRLSELGYI